MAPKDPKIEILKSIPLFSGLAGGELERIARLLDEVDVPAGKVLMRQGELGAEMFIVVSGRFTIERDGRTIAERGPGDSLGEMALLSEGPRTATVTADKGDAGIKIVSSKLTVVAHGLTGIPKEQFAEVAREADGKCPVSNAYRGSLQIEVDAKAV